MNQICSSNQVEKRSGVGFEKPGSRLKHPKKKSVFITHVTPIQEGTRLEQTTYGMRAAE